MRSRGTGSGTRLSRWAITLVLACVSVSTIYPMVFLVSTALKGRREYLTNRYGLPLQPTLENLQHAWTYGRVGEYALNSVVVVVAAVAVSCIVCALAGYALAHLRFPGRRAAFLGLLGSMIVAPQLIIIPLHGQLLRMDLLNRPIGLILVYVTLATPFGVYLLTSYFRSIPVELVEAAQMDGAGHLQVLLRVIAPVGRPAIVTLAIFNFLWMWNELLFALLILQDDSVRTLMTGLAVQRGQYTANVPLIAAGLLLAATPVLAVFFAFQGQIARGMTMGAVK